MTSASFASVPAGSEPRPYCDQPSGTRNRNPMASSWNTGLAERAGACGRAEQPKAAATNSATAARAIDLTGGLVVRVVERLAAVARAECLQDDRVDGVEQAADRPVAEREVDHRAVRREKVVRLRVVGVQEP